VVVAEFAAAFTSLLGALGGGIFSVGFSV